MTNIHIAILIFENADILDVFGPMEVFVLAGYHCDLISVHQEGQLVTLNGGVVVKSANKKAHPYDLLVFPGGPGLGELLASHKTMDYLKKEINSERYKNFASVCAGALIFDAIGYLNGKKVTTHWASRLTLQANNKITLTNARVQKNGDHFYSSAGITAGIDLALEIVEDWHGIEKRKEVEILLEYKKTEDSFEQKFSCASYSQPIEGTKRSLKKMNEIRRANIRKYKST